MSGSGLTYPRRERGSGCKTAPAGSFTQQVSQTRSGRQARNGNFKRRNAMNWDQIEGKWKELAGGVKEQWGKLTDDELTEIGGKRDRLAGLIQSKYGLAKEAVE